MIAVKKAEFLLSSPDVKQMPKALIPEFAFAGRSNVGKSSLINYLCSQRNLAKTSSTPGKTQLINQFRVDNRWCLVDLPGYGYARVSQAQRDRFRRMVVEYAVHRTALYTLFVLIDSNIPPQQSDLDFLVEVGSQSVPIAMVFTKIDHSSSTTVERNIKQFCERMYMNWDELPPMFRTSSVKRVGAAHLLQYIDTCIREVPFQPTEPDGVAG